MNYDYARKVNCPYCGSIQTKAMARQPKKYPQPSNPDDLYDWQNGFDCKKCGSDFVVNRQTTVVNVVRHQNIEIVRPKKRGFFGKLFVFIFWSIIILGVIAYFIDSNKPKNAVQEKPDSIEQIINDRQEKSESKVDSEDPTPVAIEKPKEDTYTTTEPILIDNSTIEKAANDAATGSAS